MALTDLMDSLPTPDGDLSPEMREWLVKIGVIAD